MNGALVVDKPAGPTSHDVVARVRRATREKRIGHTGTLDPLATGVLPLLLGRATRLARFLVADEKAYVAGIRLGTATATYDAEDRVIRSGPAEPVTLESAPCTVSVTAREVRDALRAFRGSFEQTPPPFSAKKIGGTPSYVLARRNAPVAMRPVQVTVHELALTGCTDGLATVEIVCSSGFYVRSLAHELGGRLGCGAHLESLRRLRAGAFTLADAVPLPDVEAQGEAIASRLIPMADLLPALPRVVVVERGARRVAHGSLIAAADLQDGAAGVPDVPDGHPIRLVDAGGELLAIGETRPGGVLQPVVVLV